MSRIGYVSRMPDGTFVGYLRTISIKSPISITPVERKVEKAPDWRIVTEDDIDLGSGWTMRNSTTGETYLNLQFSSPEFGRFYANLNPEAGIEHDGRIALMWNPTRAKSS